MAGFFCSPCRFLARGGAQRSVFLSPPTKATLAEVPSQQKGAPTCPRPTVFSALEPLMRMSNYSAYYSKGGKALADSSSDEEDERSSRKPATASSPASTKGSVQMRSINEALRHALEQAATAGEGDEEPEYLPPPDSEGQPKEKRATSREEVQREAKRRMEEATAEAAEFASECEADLQSGSLPDYTSYKERAKYIPLRLSYEERKTLRLVSAAINVSDYTSNIDIIYKNKARRYHNQLQYIVAFLTGLIASTDYNDGKEVIENRNFEKYEDSLQGMLEIIRRYKITNPEKLRSEYGKLIYLMQDSVSAEIQPLLGVHIHASVKTVYDILRDGGGLKILEEPTLSLATNEILPSKSKSKSAIQHEIRRKEAAADNLVRKYANNRLPPDLLRMCLYSINDNNSFLNSNRKPVMDCIELLEMYFDPKQIEGKYSLAIVEGTEGSRLSHSHEMQYYFVLQSLTLWAAILEDMFRLWYLAEEDLLSTTQPYELRNTGQGLQRVQPSPLVYKAMHEILVTTQTKLGNWIGSSVIHLGDHNVPNALVFIDKYTQVARILGPLVTTLRNLDTLAEENEGLQRYLDAYGGLEKAKKDILCDFFTHAFDGSGGDNFFDAGSCIDGRLTSAWNWCSQLACKPYYPLFRLTGFLSFDGQFDK